MDTLDNVFKQYSLKGDNPAGDNITPPTDTNLPVDPPAEPNNQPPANDPPVEFNLDHFNKHFGKEFKKADEIKSLFDLQGKVTEYEGKLTEYEKAKLDLSDLQKKIRRSREIY